MTIPVSTLSLSGAFADKLIRMSAQVFVIAIKIGAPVIAALFMVQIAMAVVARSFPSMNVFIVGFPLKIGVGLLAIGLSLSFFVHMFHKFWIRAEGDITQILKLL